MVTRQATVRKREREEKRERETDHRRERRERKLVLLCCCSTVVLICFTCPAIAVDRYISRGSQSEKVAEKKREQITDNNKGREREAVVPRACPLSELMPAW